MVEARASVLVGEGRVSFRDVGTRAAGGACRRRPGRDSTNARGATIREYFKSGSWEERIIKNGHSEQQITKALKEECVAVDPRNSSCQKARGVRTNYHEWPSNQLVPQRPCR